MTDADLIYNALLRAERRLEPPTGAVILDAAVMQQMAAFKALQTLREEIGRGLSEQGR